MRKIYVAKNKAKDRMRLKARVFQLLVLSLFESVVMTVLALTVHAAVEETDYKFFGISQVEVLEIHTLPYITQIDVEAREVIEYADVVGITEQEVKNDSLIAQPSVVKTQVLHEEKQPTMEEILDYEISEEERLLLAQLVACESGNQNLLEQEKVVMVVLNRLATDDYDTIYDVIYAEGQFTTAHMLVDTMPTELNFLAVDKAVAGDIADFPCKYFYGTGDRNHFSIEFNGPEFHYEK